MRRLRRHAAALLGALLLQVLFLGSGVACVTAAGGTDVHATHDEHAGHDPVTAPGDDAGDDASDVPDHTTAPAHCLATMSCATAGLAATRATLDADDVTPAIAIAAHDDAAPASIGGAPEPPPPRG